MGKDSEIYQLVTWAKTTTYHRQHSGVSEELWHVARRLNTYYYPIWRLWSFVVPVINICHPDDIEILFSSTKHIEKSIVYKYLHPWFGTGLLTSTGSKWQHRRKILTPAFHFNVLKQFIDIFIEEGEHMSQSLKTSDGSPVVRDLVSYISEHTLNIICETAMGTSLKDKGEFQYKYRKAVHDMGTILGYRFLRPWFHLDAMFLFSPKRWKQTKLLKILHGFTNQIITERMQYHEQTGGRYLKSLDDEHINRYMDEDEYVPGIRKRRLAMLDLLIAAHRDGNQIDENGIREEVDTFMFEGHDTTAMAICFTLIQLAEHKDIQDRARVEVKAAFEEHGGKLTMAAIQGMQYLERCIKEALRLHPSVPFISRSTPEDLQLKKFLIPSGTVVHVHIYELHRDPNFWPNPDVFDPDRFLPEKIQGRHPFCYVPFSAGPRNCIGQRFAMLEMKSMIAHLLKDFYLEPIDRIKDIRMITDLDTISENLIQRKTQFSSIIHRGKFTQSYKMIFTILLAFIGLVLLHYFYVKYSRFGRLIDRLPGPISYPIFGNLVDMQMDNVKFFTRLRELNVTYYPIYRLWHMAHPTVNFLHPKDIEIILSNAKHIDKSFPYKLLEPWLATGLLTSTGAKWQKRRKILTPAFHFNILTQFVDILIEESQHLVRTLKEKAEGGPIVKDVLDLTSQCTLNAICETAMGISLKGKNTIPDKYRKAVHILGSNISFRLLRPWYTNDYIFQFSKEGQMQTRLLKLLHGFTESIITERKQYHESTNEKYLLDMDNMNEKNVNSNVDTDDNEVSTGKRRLAMLDLLIFASLKDNEIDDKGIREEVDTFTFEGHDTTAMALCFALLLFAKHKDVQERIRDEVNTVMLEKDYKLTISVLQGFSYLERCIKETLRLYPSVPFISRQINQDCQLKNYLLPAGTTCHIHIYDLHRDPNFWPNPLVFDPDRFLPENVKGRHPYSYIPFSAGLRNCIGQKFAMLEMKLIIAYILHNFALEPVDELDNVQLKTDLVLRPAKPIFVKFIPLG
ncbi:hypothetical protein KPH14_003416 [Odynerus spinipes]|uniref:Cytochrome P450 n=1 Tax=Odynerus spinipes TaxID=1348599 RepID=A0AAD9VJY6_9HYME|nr:hypothetical protein KPH14_003416 [Odynerus spinipes]